ncbi:MAG: HAD family phosphatase [Bacteroidales bacterium]|nr:HAD family phosphatase [Bacteroidales bacterium]
MLKNIIFDFGGVLLDLRPDRCIEQFEALGYGRIKEVLSLAHQQGPLGKVEEGHLTLETFCDEIRKEILVEHPDWTSEQLPDNRQIVCAFASMADGVPHERLDIIDDLKREGYHVSALSNTNLIHWGYCQRYFIEAGYVPTELFEHLWLSCELHLVKPNPQIFSLILERSGYRHEETLFVDDNPKNCEVAQSFGIHTFCPPVRTDWRADLRTLLAEFK